MFTTGSKLFLGATTLAVVATVVVAATQGGEPGWLGTIGLVGAAVALAALCAVNFYTHDGNTSSMEPDVTTTAAAAQPATQRSGAPLLVAVGAGLLAIGAVTRPAFFKGGIIALLLAGGVWLVHSWADRASGDRRYNAFVGERTLEPFKLPLLVVVLMGVLVYSFSRVMLWIDKSGGPVVFGVIGALLVVGGFLVASRPKLSTGLITGIGAIAALGLVSAGAVMAIDGQRHIEKHATTALEPAVCGEAEADSHVDKRPPGDVFIHASQSARVEVKDGKIAVYSQGLQGPRPDVTFALGGNYNILFLNRDSVPRRFTINMGKFTTTENGVEKVSEPKLCTTIVEPGKQAVKTVRFAVPSAASEAPFTITVPGIDDQAITVFVP